MIQNMEILAFDQTIVIENLNSKLNTKNPLPVGYYFHPKYWGFRKQLFADGANYIGHELMIPNVWDYRVLETMNDQYILLRRDDGSCVMISNICRHQQARLIDPENRGHNSLRRANGDRRSGNLKALNNAGLLVCPVHRWSYKHDGRLHHAPKFEKKPDTCLPVIELKSWNGMLFHTHRDISYDMALLGHSGYFNPRLLDMNNYVYIGSDTPINYEFSWEKFIKVYLDLYHVAPYHPNTFAQIINCHDFKWELGERYSMQIAGWKSDQPKVNEDAPYNKIWFSIKEHFGGYQPEHGALWLLLYPGVMVEWYPHLLVISLVQPTSYESCVNFVEYYVSKEWKNSSSLIRAKETIDNAKLAYKLSAIEDMEICKTMHDSYRNMWNSGEHFVGPCHSYLELGIEYFFEYINTEWKIKHKSEIEDLKK